MPKKDIVSKQVIKHLTVDLAHYLLGLDIDPDRIELLPTEQQRIEDRRADLVARVVDRATGREFILHIEIQNDNQAEMPLRMLRYYTDIRLSYPKHELRQFLVYIGKSPLTMAAGIDEPGHQYHYQLIDMHNIDCEALLAQDGVVSPNPRKFRQPKSSMCKSLPQQKRDPKVPCASLQDLPPQ